MGGEMHRRAPAARHGDEIAVNTLDLAALVSDLDAADGLATPHALDHGARKIAGLRLLGRGLRAR
jgi:hypothetical protein